MAALDARPYKPETQARNQAGFFDATGCVGGFLREYPTQTARWN
jgi:hypothetical protein